MQSMVLSPSIITKNPSKYLVGRPLRDTRVSLMKLWDSPPSTSIVTISSTSTRVHTPLRYLGSSMADEMRLPIFKGDGSEDSDQ